MVSNTLKALRAQRLHWIEVRPASDGVSALAVQVRRPLEAELYKFSAGVTAEHVCEFVTAWKGFTEADILGPSVGASDPLEFDAELWSEWVRDNAGYVQAIAAGIRDLIQQHLEKVGAAAKN